MTKCLQDKMLAALLMLCADTASKEAAQPQDRQHQRELKLLTFIQCVKGKNPSSASSCDATWLAAYENNCSDTNRPSEETHRWAFSIRPVPNAEIAVNTDSNCASQP